MNKQERINELIEKLALLPHPEGGYYKETYRSSETIDGEQALMTSILFLLTSDSPSHFHRIQSDEHWYFHEGSPLTVHVIGEKFELGLSRILGMVHGKIGIPQQQIGGFIAFCINDNPDAGGNMDVLFVDDIGGFCRFAYP